MAPKRQKPVELQDVLEKERPIIFVKDSKLYVECKTHEQVEIKTNIDTMVLENKPKPKKKVVKKLVAAPAPPQSA